MACYCIVGAADCPYFARAQRLGELLREALPASAKHITIEMKNPGEWLDYVASLEQRLGFVEFRASKSRGETQGRVVVYDPRSNRIIGSEAQFKNLVYEKYGISCDLQWPHLQAIAKENEIMFRKALDFKKLKPVQIILAGGPGTGKTTIAKELCAKYALKYVSTKEIIQETSKKLTPLGKRMALCLEKGQPILDEDITPLVLEKIQALKQGWVLEGFPATEVQAQTLLTNNITPGLVLILQLSKEHSVQRLALRKLNTETKATMYLDDLKDFSRQKREDIEKKLIAHPGNSVEAITKRLVTFNSRTNAVLHHFYNDIIFKVNTAPALDIVKDACYEAVDELKR